MILLTTFDGALLGLLEGDCIGLWKNGDADGDLLGLWLDEG